MIEHQRPRIQNVLRYRFGSFRPRRAARAALAVVVASVVALPAGTGTALAHEHVAVQRAPGVAIGRTADGAVGRGHGGDSSAVAVNTRDNSLVFKLTFAIVTVTGDVVDNLNLADAYANCNQCQTVAISIQTLLVDSAASTVAPINAASARNQNCQQCDTVALAYQFVVADGTQLAFTPQGRREVAYIRRQLEMLRREARRSGMTGAQIVAAVTALMQQYTGILNTQLVPASQSGAQTKSAGASGATPPAGVNSTTAVAPSGSTTTGTTAASASPGSVTPQSTTTSPMSGSTPTSTSGATTTTSGATTAPSGATTTTSSSTPSTTTTGTTATSGPTGTTASTSGTTTTTSGTTTTNSSSAPSTTTP